MTETTVAVVVTHNRPAKLTQCIAALLRQTVPLRRIVLVDNASAPETEMSLREIGYLPHPRIEYHYLSKNVGGAGGFDFGMQKASHRAEWLWLMDDDTEARPDALACHAALQRDANSIALACRKVYPEGDTQWHHSGYFSRWRGFQPLPPTRSVTRVDYASFAGLLVRASATDAVGYPRADFFIGYDDMEFCLRLRRHGNILFVPDAVMVHYERRAPRSGTFRRAFPRRSEIEQYWRVLCGYRNHLYLMRRYGAAGGARSVAALARKLAKIWILEDHKRLRTRFILRYHRDSYQELFSSLTPEQWSEIVNVASARGI